MYWLCCKLYVLRASYRIFRKHNEQLCKMWWVGEDGDFYWYGPGGSKGASQKIHVIAWIHLTCCLPRLLPWSVLTSNTTVQEQLERRYIMGMLTYVNAQIPKRSLWPDYSFTQQRVVILGWKIRANFRAVGKPHQQLRQLRSAEEDVCWYCL